MGLDELGQVEVSADRTIDQFGVGDDLEAGTWSERLRGGDGESLADFEVVHVVQAVGLSDCSYADVVAGGDLVEGVAGLDHVVFRVLAQGGQGARGIGGRG